MIGGPELFARNAERGTSRLNLEWMGSHHRVGATQGDDEIVVTNNFPPQPRNFLGGEREIERGEP